MFPMLRILGTAFAALVGLAFGSFLNVCLSRWPEGESIATPRSHCRNCERTLAWWENVPLVSWLALRGRCRTCKARISLRYLFVELMVGAGWALIVFSIFPNNISLVPLDFLLTVAIYGLSQIVLLWLFVALAVLDFEHLWLPDKITIPGILAGFAITVLYAAENSKRVFGFYGALSLRNRFLWQVFWHRLLAIFLAALLILLIRWTYKLIRKREGIGLGDAKLMAMLAAWLGLEGALLSFFIGVALGSVAALIVLANPASRAKDSNWALTKLPLGTFLCIGGIVSALYGQPILAAYLRWAGF
jgi:leader peptidase (prepilin peptidase)/N-methyltransferase